MKDKFEIFDRIINDSSSTLIIAEIGINHMGNEELCKKMILSAIDSGADCVKLQTAKIDESFHPDNISYATFKGTELSKNSLKRLSLFAAENGSYLFSSPGDLSSVNLLKSINVAAYKISSGQLTNIPLIDEVIKQNKPIIFSTGMAKEIEIKKIVDLCRMRKISNFAFLHCVSLYPSLNEYLNLGFIKKIRNKFKVISGYSDHTSGDLACLSAVSMGAKIIEKHFTIDSELPGGDNAMSMNPLDFKNMCLQIREIEKMIYSSNIKPHPLEMELRGTRYRKLVAKKDILPGEVFTKFNVNFMRINEERLGIYSSEWGQIEGKNSKRLIKKNSLITTDCF